MKKQNWLPKRAWNFYPNNDQYFTKEETQYTVKRYNRQIRQYYKHAVRLADGDLMGL